MSGYASDSWLGTRGWTVEKDGHAIGLSKTTFKAVFPLLCTPPWALHVGLSGPDHVHRDLLDHVVRRRALLNVLDLGPDALAEPPRGWTSVTRHTRQLVLEDNVDNAIPKTRLKQARRFEREGGTVSLHEHKEGWEQVLALHKASRTRKGLPHRGSDLQALLDRISKEPWTFAVTAHDAGGVCVASGGFVLLPSGTCVYAFGGQRRSEVSGRASVAMLLEAMRMAQTRGCTRFDFGGSLDPGVDRFYAEFGANAVAMERWVGVPFWFKWLFPRTWRAWTKSSPHF